MKHIRIFGIFLLLALLFLPLDVFACDDLEAARNAAQQKVNEAEAAYTTARNIAILKGIKAIGETVKDSDRGPVKEAADDAEVLKEVFKMNEASQALDAAKEALAAAQKVLDLCKGHETRSCGCSVSDT